MTDDKKIFSKLSLEKKDLMKETKNKVSSKPKKFILDACCGGKQFWYNKNHPNTIYIDIRKGNFPTPDWPTFKVDPNIVMDFRKMDFPDKSFKLVIFDPPHMKLGPNSHMADRYGVFYAWEIRQLVFEGFREFERVLKKDGTVMFKWNDHDVNLGKILELAPANFQPLFAQKVAIRTRHSSVTSWVCLIKK